MEYIQVLGTLLALLGVASMGLAFVAAAITAMKERDWPQLLLFGAIVTMIAGGILIAISKAAKPEALP